MARFSKRKLSKAALSISKAEHRHVRVNSRIKAASENALRLHKQDQQYVDNSSTGSTAFGT